MTKNWKFSGIPYHRPDYKALQNKLDALTIRIKEAKDFETVKDAMEERFTLLSDVGTMEAIAFCRAYQDMTDAFYQQELSYIGEHRAMLKTEPLSGAIVNSPFRAEIDQTFGSQLCVLLDAQMRLTEHGKEIAARIEELTNAYQSMKAQLRYDLRGEAVTEAKLTQALYGTDRMLRKEAYEASLRTIVEHKRELSEMLRELVKARNQLARANGYDSFIDYGNCKNGRIGYGHRELTSFVQEVQQHIVPLYLRLQEEQRKRLGVDVLYPYDTTVLFADGNAKHVDGEEALRQAGYAMYHALSPEAGAFFDEMVAHEMIDVAYSDKKIYGMGFAEYIAGEWKMPFVFSNSNGTTADVTVYTHELGHAFQGYLTMQEQILDYLDGGPDYHEIHSKTMELLAEPYAEGFFGTDAERFLTEKRYCMIKELCAFGQIYAFESYLYTHEDAPVEEWAKQYYEIGKTFGRGLHSEQWEDAIVNGGILLDSMALFFAPMYVISYALSELCALQLKEAYDANPADGWAKYRAICACGSSKPLEESLREAGLTPPYAPGTVKRIAASLEKLLFGA